MDEAYTLSPVQEALTAFLDAATELEQVKYILAEKKISQLLETIACYPLLVDFFGSALNGYNRNDQWQNAKTKVGGRSKLTLPSSKIKLVAFVFCLLLEIDTGKRSLKEVLDEFFFSSRPNEQYASFAQNVITPFKTTVQYLMSGGEDGGEAVDSSIVTTVKTLLRDLNALVSDSDKLEYETKQQLFTITRAIESALTPNRIDLIKPLVIGYRSVIIHSGDALTLLPYYDKLFATLSSSDMI